MKKEESKAIDVQGQAAHTAIQNVLDGINLPKEKHTLRAKMHALTLATTEVLYDLVRLHNKDHDEACPCNVEVAQSFLDLQRQALCDEMQRKLVAAGVYGTPSEAGARDEVLDLIRNIFGPDASVESIFGPGVSVGRVVKDRG